MMGRVAAPLRVMAARATAATAIALWVHTSTVRLSKRSAINPAQTPSSRVGRNCSAIAAPTANPLLWDRFRTNHPSAMVCIQVPMSDTIWPPKKSR